MYNLGVSDIIENTARVLFPFSKNKLAVGVSGGRDSMCLLHAVMSCGVVEKSAITAVHVNHCLREQADDDERFVREFCEKNGIAFRAFKVDVKKESALNGLTVEQAARNMRYASFYELIKSGEAEFILTAHHALDNAESILMHLFRGAGLDGLCGMSESPRSDGLCGAENNAGELPLIRPFLNVYPKELDEYAAAHGISYVVDKTNFELDADRNFIRLKIIPAIEERYAGVVRAVGNLATEAKGVCEVLDGELDLGLIGDDYGAVTLADEALSSPLAARYVRRALMFFTTVDVTREQILRVTELAHMRTGATVELSGGIKAAREYGRLALYLERPSFAGEIEIVRGANFIDGLAVDVLPSDDYPKTVRGGAVDLDKLEGAVLRFRREGDMFTPCGGKRKKLKQYFIDNKIPKRLRDRIPLVCRGNDVLVVVGMQVADEAKQTEKTTAKAIIRLRGRT